MDHSTRAISHPLLNKRRPWCDLFTPQNPWCRKKGILADAAVIDSYTARNAPLQLVPHPRIFSSALARNSAIKPVHGIWRLAIAFARLVRSADVEIKRIAMNGRRAGCHYREAHPIGEPVEGCNTHYTAGTEAHARLEIREAAGEAGVSRVYRFWVQYTKPVLHKFKGTIPITTFGVYGDIGPNGNKRGPLCDSASLGPFSVNSCAASERHFRVPLGGTIPLNWVARHGQLVYALDYPFNFTTTFTKGFLGVWGMVDRDMYRRMGVPYMNFPTRIDHLVELFSTIDTRRATHINLNKPYNRVTGPWPHIEWLDLHDARATLLLRDGSIDVSGIGRITFDRGAYLKESRLDRHPRLMAIAQEWRKHRAGGLSPDAANAARLAAEYYRSREIIREDTGRIDIRSTAHGITITIHNPPVTQLDLPLGALKLAARGLSIGTITIELPSVEDLRAKRKRITEATVSIEGITARSVTVADAAGDVVANISDIRIGTLRGNFGKHVSLAHLTVGAWSASLGHGSIAIEGGATAVENATADFTPSAKHISIGGISLDIKTGRVGSVGLGRATIGEGRVGASTIRSGILDIAHVGGVLTAGIGGMIDVVLNKTRGQRLDLNIPGLDLSGTLGNIRVRGPAHVLLTPTSWDISHLIISGRPPAPLSIAAHLTGGLMVHDPSARDHSLRGSPHQAAITTRLAIDSADLKIGDVRRLMYLTARHPGLDRGRFQHMAVGDASISSITGSGRAWMKIPVWNYVGIDFRKLRGDVTVKDVSVKANGAGPRTKIAGIVLDLKETGGDAHRCHTEIPLIMFSRQGYFIGDPGGRPLKLDCRFNAWLKDGYFHFRNKERPLDQRRPYR